MNTIIGRKLAVPDYPIYPLTPESVPCDWLILPELGYRPIHEETQLRILGQFTAAEANLTQKVTRCWDWQADRASQPACTKGLLQILERLCAAPSEIQEVAS